MALVMLSGMPVMADPQSGLAGTQPAATEPAPAPIVVRLRATITGLEGLVQVRTAEDQPWQTPVIGMKLDQGAELRTGPRSAVRFAIPPDQTVTLDRLGTITILQATRNAGKVKTDLGMKYGRTRYAIEAAGLEHESRIHTPNSELAVRGTRVSIYDQPPFAPEAVSLTGRAVYTNTKGTMVPFGAKGVKTAVSGGEFGAAEHAVLKTNANPISLADSDDQQRLFFIYQRATLARLASLINNGIEFTEIQSTMTPYSTLMPLSVMLNDSRQASTLGPLVFDLSWTTQSNVNLFIFAPGQQVLGSYFTNQPSSSTHSTIPIPINGVLPMVPSNGQIDPGPYNSYKTNLPASGGRETAYWSTATFLPGTYTLKANLEAGQTAEVTLNVYENGVIQPKLTKEITISPRDPTATVERITIKK